MNTPIDINLTQILYYLNQAGIPASWIPIGYIIWKLALKPGIDWFKHTVESHLQLLTENNRLLEKLNGDIARIVVK